MRNNNVSIRKVSQTDKIAAFIVAVIFLLRLKPFYIWPNIDGVQAACALFLPLIGLFYVRKIKFGEFFYLGVFLISYALILFQSKSPITIINRFLLIIIPLLKFEFIEKCFDYFKTILSVFFFLGIIEYILSVTGILSPIGLITPLNDLKSYTYYRYFFSVLGSESLRFCSIFDEPGVVGTICAILVFCQQTKRPFSGIRDIVILTAGLLSFSFFFYAFLAVYFVGYAMVSGNRKALLPMVFALVVGVVAIRAIPFLWDMIGSRFVFDPMSGGFEGDTRNTERTIELISSAGLSPEVLLFGVGRDYAEQFDGQSSILIVGFLDGFLFIIINLLGYIVMGLQKLLSKSKVRFFLFIILVIGTFYQRPELVNPGYIFLLISLCYKILNVSISKE